MRVLYSVANSLLHAKDFAAAVAVLESIVTRDPSHQSALLCSIGRVYLQVSQQGESAGLTWRR